MIFRTNILICNIKLSKDFGIGVISGVNISHDFSGYIYPKNIYEGLGTLPANIRDIRFYGIVLFERKQFEMHSLNV